MPNEQGQRLEKIGYFYNRGADTTRLETFVDAAFAFALTLLVISFDAVPSSYEELIIALRAIPAFLFGFSILMMFWAAHRKWSIRFGLDTGAAMIISLALVFVILVYVYPLRAMSTAAVSAITNGWLPTDFKVTSYEEVRGLFAIYSSGFCLCAACIITLNAHALSLRSALSLTPEEIFLTKGEICSWLLVGAIGFASVIMAFTLPDTMVGFSGWVYASLAIVMPIYGWQVSRLFDKHFPASKPA